MIEFGVQLDYAETQIWFVSHFSVGFAIVLTLLLLCSRQFILYSERFSYFLWFRMFFSHAWAIKLMLYVAEYNGAGVFLH